MSVRFGLHSPLNQTTAGGGSAPNEVDAMRVGVACAVTLLAGVMKILMGVCRLGVELSDQRETDIRMWCHLVEHTIMWP